MALPLLSIVSRYLRVVSALALAAFACNSDAPPPVTTSTVVLASGGSLTLHTLGTTGDTVLVLPGGPAFGSGYLQRALAPLAVRHTLIFVDFRGRGESPSVPAESLSMTLDLRDLEVVRRQLQLDSFSIVGHHWGAGTAMLYAVSHPHVVRRLALIGPMADGITSIYELTRLPHDSLAIARHASAIASGMAQLDPDRYCRNYWGFALSPAEEVDPTVIRRLGPSVCSAPILRLQESPGVARALLGSLGAWEWRDTLGLVAAPTLVVAGDRDTQRAEAARLWATRVSDGRLLLLSGSSAFPWVTDSRGFINGIERFLDGAWPIAPPPASPTTTVSRADRD